MGKGIHNTLVDIIFADGSALVDDEGNELTFWLVAGARRDANYAGSNGSVNTATHIGGIGSYIAMTVKGYMTDDCWDDEFVPWLIRMITERKKQLGQDAKAWYLLVMDGFGSHTMTPKALRLLWEAAIYSEQASIRFRGWGVALHMFLK